MAQDFRFLWYWNGEGKWRRVDVKRLVELVVGLENPVNQYMSPQLYQEAAARAGERVWLHPYFDLDCKEDPEEAFHEARTLSRYFEDEVGLGPEHQRWNYSGQKGFHCVLNGFALGIKPHVDVTGICRLMVETTAKVLDLTTVDTGVYSSARVLRIPNTVHGSTGRSAVAISVDSLRTKAFVDVVNASVERKKPAPVWRLFERCEPCGDESFWPLFVSTFEARKALLQHKPKSSVKKSHGGGDYPPCIRDQLDTGVKSEGLRNKTTFNLAIYHEQAGYPQDQAEEVIEEWTHRVHAQVTGQSPAPAAVLRNMRSTIHSVYTNPGVFFSCAFSRSCGTERNPVKCNPNCGVVVAEDQGMADARPRLSLEESVKAEHVGKEVSFDGLVLAKEPQPQVIPYEARISCKPQSEGPCKGCALAGARGAVASLDGREDLVLEVAHQQRKDYILKTFDRLAGVPKDCPGHYSEITRSENLLHVLIQSTIHGHTDNGKISWRENVVALLSHTIEDQKVYSFDARLFPNPKTKDAVHVATEARHVMSGIDTFQMDDDKHERLRIFQPKEGQELEKVIDIFEDWEANVHHIYGRLWESTAIGLTWFSPLQLIRDGKIVRGWLEAMSFGDTAQGKSEIANRFNEFFGHGQVISGEATSLPGLLMGVEKLNGKNVPRIGALCRNDRGHLHIDEWGAMGLDCKSGMTSSRSSGKVVLSKIAHAEAMGRCRKVVSSNCVDERGRPSSMSAKPYGCQHIINIATSPEDARRFDYAVAFRESPEITSAIYSKRKTVKHVYTSDNAHLLILWVWTRLPHQVVFLPETMRRIMEYSKILSDTYSRNIPLLDPGDTPNKLMRISASYAGLLFSTDDGERILVKPEHVEITDHMLQQIYMSQDMQYLQYSQHDRMAKPATMDEMMSASMEVAWHPQCKPGLMFLLESDSVSRFDLQDVVSMEQEQAAAFLAGLRAHAMITRVPSGFALTHRGIQISKMILDHWRDHGEPLHGKIAVPPPPD